MGPKKKGGKKGKKSGKGGKTPVLIDGKPPGDLPREELERHIDQLKEQHDRDVDERNYFQLERDKINMFWEITKRQLEEKKAELRNKDRYLEDAEERHQIEIKVYKQKVKHLLYEHQNLLAEAKAESELAMRMAEDKQRAAEATLRGDQRSLRTHVKEQELAQQDSMKAIKLEHDKNLSELRGDFERQARELEQKYEKKMQKLRDELDLRRKTELHEIEERKNLQINELIRQHEKAFSDIKNYYNDITLNNLALINTLKEQKEDMKKQEERMERQMAEVMAENKRLEEPKRAAEAMVEELKKKLSSHQQDKAALIATKNKLKTTTLEAQELRWEHEVLTQRFEKVVKERDQLYEKFVKAVREVQEKASFKNLLLEKKLGAVTDSLEKKDAQLNEVLSASNLDPGALSVVTRKLEDVLDSKNAAIKDLQYELARVCKAHNDLLAAMESRLGQFGIPAAELGFKPLATMVQPQLGEGPAGLVSAPN